MEMPGSIGEFIGRRGDLESLREIVRRSNARCTSDPVIVTIDGQAGTGTSTLAAHFAREKSIDYPHGLLYVDLKGASGVPLTPVAALCQLMRGQGVRSVDLPPDLERLASTYRASLRGRHVIVVLDNAASESQVRPLLPVEAGCLVLITSRQPLTGLRCSSSHSLGVMSEKESIALLARVAGEGVRGRRTAREAKRVVALCGCLPLAVSIVGMALRSAPVWTIADLRVRLDERRSSTLGSGNPDVRASFDVGYERLSAPQQTLFRRLQLLPAPSFDAGAAAALTGMEQQDAQRILDDLVDRQLLRGAPNGRYGFHDLLGQFANELLQQESTTDRQAAHDCALRFYLEQVTDRTRFLDPSVLELGQAPAAEPAATLDEQIEALEWLEHERPTLVMACRQAAQVQSHDLTWRLIASLVPFFEVRGHRTDWAEAQAAALTAARESGDLLAQAWSHLGAGQFHGLDGRWDEARSHLEEALEMARAGGWPRLQARALYLMGRVEHDRGEREAALGRYHRAAAIFSEKDMLAEQARTMLAIGAALHERDEIPTDDVIGLGDSVLDALSPMPDDFWTMRTIGRICEYLGRVEANRGQLERADVYAGRSRQAFSRIGFRHGQGRALRDLGRLKLEQRHWTHATTLLDESTALFRTTGDRRSEREARQLAGVALVRLGGVAAAHLHLQDARTAMPPIRPLTADQL